MKRGCLSVVVIGITLLLQAQEQMYVFKKDDTQRAFDLRTAEIAFNSNGDVLIRQNGTSVTYVESLIKEILFELESSPKVSAYVADGAIYLSGFAPGTIRDIRLFDSSGHYRMEENSRNLSLPIDVKSISRGVYFLRIDDSTFKVIR